MPATRLKIRKKNPAGTPSEVWIVEDDEMLSQIISRFLKARQIPCRIFNTMEDFSHAMVSADPERLLLLLDYYLDQGTALDLVRQLPYPSSSLYFLVMTGKGDESLAVNIMKAGALDYLVKTKDFVHHLPLAIRQAFERMEMARQLKYSQRHLQLSLHRQKRLNARVIRQKIALEQEQARAYKLLTNVLPEKIAREILSQGTAKASYFPNVSVLFADIEDFSSMAKTFSPIDLVQKLDDYFTEFDQIMEKFQLEKIKTIGDCYMCAGGIPEKDPVNAFRVVLAGLQIQQVLVEKSLAARKTGDKGFDMRIGIHTGEVVAGVVGNKKFAYDVWGDAANTASYMVQAGGVNRVNISRSTYEMVGDFFECQPRGMVVVKNQKLVEMFFVDRLKPQYAADGRGITPNKNFWAAIRNLSL